METIWDYIRKKVQKIKSYDTKSVEPVYVLYSTSTRCVWNTLKSILYIVVKSVESILK